MSISFYGKTSDGRRIHVDVEAAEHLNLSNENARALLLLLGLDDTDVLSGEMTLPEARRAIMFARATFARRVDRFTRPARDTKPPGKVRVVESGRGADYLTQRLDDLERVLRVVFRDGRHRHRLGMSAAAAPVGNLPSVLDPGLTAKLALAHRGEPVPTERVGASDPTRTGRIFQRRGLVLEDSS